MNNKREVLGGTEFLMGNTRRQELQTRQYQEVELGRTSRQEQGSTRSQVLCGKRKQVLGSARRQALGITRREVLIVFERQVLDSTKRQVLCNILLVGSTQFQEKSTRQEVGGTKKYQEYYLYLVGEVCLKSRLTGDLCFLQV